MNYGDIKQDWKTWSHRTDLDDQKIKSIELYTRKRLGRDIRTDFNLTVETWDIPADGYEVPDGLMEIRTVKNAKGESFLFVTPTAFSAYKGSIGYYTFYDGKIHLSKAGEADVSYWSEPDALVLDSDTNALLTQWPNLYLYGGLREIYKLTQELDSLAIMERQYQNEIALVNKQAQARRTGIAPVMESI